MEILDVQLYSLTLFCIAFRTMLPGYCFTKAEVAPDITSAESQVDLFNYKCISGLIFFLSPHWYAASAVSKEKL